MRYMRYSVQLRENVYHLYKFTILPPNYVFPYLYDTIQISNDSKTKKNMFLIGETILCNFL